MISKLKIELKIVIKLVLQDRFHKNAMHLIESVTFVYVSSADHSLLMFCELQIIIYNEI